MNRRGFIVNALTTIAPLTIPKALPLRDPAAPARPPRPLPPCPPNHPAHAPAVLALQEALDALDALRDGCCGDGLLCAVCLDADGIAVPLGLTHSLLESELVGGRLGLPSAPAATPAGADKERCVLALYEALDALLDMSAFHCIGESCDVCQDADRGLYGVRLGLDLIGCVFVSTSAVWERARRSAVGKVDRLRRVRAAGGRWQPHAWNEHRGAEEELRSLSEVVRLMGGV